MKCGIYLLLGVLAIGVTGCTSSEGYFRQDYDYTAVQKIAVIDVIGPVGGDVRKEERPVGLPDRPLGELKAGRQLFGIA